MAAQFPVQIGEPVLVEALAYADARLQLVAAVGLAAFANPLGRIILEAEAHAAVGRDRKSIVSALARLDQTVWGPDYGLVVRVDSTNRLVVFDTAGGTVYIGQLLEIHRDGVRVARISVTRRHGGEPLAVGAVETGSFVQPGDSVHEEGSAKP